MKIDIQPGDTFSVDERGRILQYRDGNGRGIGGTEWMQLTLAGRSLSRDLFTQIATAAGHTITEATLAPTPVPWPTHAVVGKINGVVYRMGTKEQCDLWTKETSLSCDSHEVRPLAPAPPSDKMKEFISAIASDAAQTSWNVRKAAAELLTEAGEA